MTFNRHPSLRGHINTLPCFTQWTVLCVLLLNLLTVKLESRNNSWISVTVINNAANRPQRIRPAIVSRMSPSSLCRRVAYISLIDITPVQIRKLLSLSVCVSLCLSPVIISCPVDRWAELWVQSCALPVVLPSQSSIQSSLWRCQLISWVLWLVSFCLSLTKLFDTNPPPCISTRTTFSTAVVGDVWRLCKVSYQLQTDNSFFS